MSDIPYPISENAPDRLRSAKGRPFAELTLDNVLDGSVDHGDFSITEDALRYQAEVARRACRGTLADSFERAAEMVKVPNAILMETYELLRPGRAESADLLFERARLLREEFGAERMALFIEEAANAYIRRSLFRRRY
ncbi:diol dehydratase small subunit [Shinella pollutisoli]|uniref:Diol dehydratase small subunit n=1 Tax=Shinella pollutisoli TaxID=2250594 RepID=A0ABV7DI74_9HYPH|nr:diol dehydratase small subunit [Shinella pollutisoli]